MPYATSIDTSPTIKLTLHIYTNSINNRRVNWSVNLIKFLMKWLLLPAPPKNPNRQICPYSQPPNTIVSHFHPTIQHHATCKHRHLTPSLETLMQGRRRRCSPRQKRSRMRPYFGKACSEVISFFILMERSFPKVSKNQYLLKRLFQKYIWIFPKRSFQETLSF